MTPKAWAECFQGRVAAAYPNSLDMADPGNLRLGGCFHLRQVVVVVDTRHRQDSLYGIHRCRNLGCRTTQVQDREL